MSAPNHAMITPTKAPIPPLVHAALIRALANDLLCLDRLTAKAPEPVPSTVPVTPLTTVSTTANVTPATEADDTDAVLQSIGVLPASSSDQKGAA